MFEKILQGVHLLWEGRFIRDMIVCVCVFKILLKLSIMLLSPPLKPKKIQLCEKRCYEPGKHPP